MHIWVDADACPLAVKEILYRAAERAQVRMTLVANKLLGTPRSPWISALQVARGATRTASALPTSLTGFLREDLGPRSMHSGTTVLRGDDGASMFWYITLE